MDYITPQIIEYDNIDDLLKNDNKFHSLFNNKEVPINKLLQKNFVCIVGEPGIGKSRLLKEIMYQINTDSYFSCTASEFVNKVDIIPQNIQYCFIDALDEVEGNLFHNTLNSIKQYKFDCHNIKVFFTCRKHYVASYANHFELCKNLTFVEINRLSENDLMKVINERPNTTQDNINKNSKLKELLTIPRYLKYLLDYETQKGEIINISELFEYIIENSIESAINSCKSKDKINTGDLKILIERVLEKVAFIMEISRKDQISKDELYTILDEVEGNMTQMFIVNINLLFFKNRILKETNGILQFDNTEIQEYLAAKELRRQDNIESVLYDIAVQKDLKHIYPNWYDVIPHLSYTRNKASTFINVIKLVICYESGIDNETFESLLRYVDSSILSNQQKEELFLILLEYYLRVSKYIRWKGQVLKLMQKCYTSSCCNRLLLPYDNLNKIQIANIYNVLEAIVENDKLDKDIFDYWTIAADKFIGDNDEEKKLAALNIYNSLNNKDKLVCLSKHYNNFAKIVKEKYCEITGYNMYTNQSVIDCWLSGCFERNPYAINAVLHIEAPSVIIYAYSKIIEYRKFYEFYNSQGTFHVFYEIHLDKQFNILWNYNNSDGKKLITKIIASYIDNNLYINHGIICPIVKRILLEKNYGCEFIKYFDKEWRLKNIFNQFDEKLIDAELLHILEEELLESDVEEWRIDDILKYFTNKIRKDKIKKDTISDYIERYAETFKKWDKDSEIKANSKFENPDYIETYNKLYDNTIPMKTKYEIAYMLSYEIEFIERQDPQPLVNVISLFFTEIDLDNLTIEKTGNNSYNISRDLIKIPCFIKLLIHLGRIELLIQNRILLAKTLPIVYVNANFDIKEILNAYKTIIGTLSEQDKDELAKWWKSRLDDYINVSSDSIFTCIEEYGIDAFAYKLEEYIDDYITHQDLDNRLNASKSLELISKGYCNWNIEKYRDLFNALEDDSIEGVKIECNAIMIEKYQDIEAIKWRIEYLRKNVFKSTYDDTAQIRCISIKESEVTSSNPYMFRCFLNIKGNEKLDELMYELFDFALELSLKYETQQYSRYLISQIYHFFMNCDNIHYLYELRKRVEKFNSTNVSFVANDIMIHNEIIYLQKEQDSISRSVKLYNKCTKESHLRIRNDGDLRRYFTYIQSEVQKEIQDRGIYALVRQENLNEDFIQRELKNTIINKCCQMGLETVQVDREVTLQDNKRTDLLVRYGMCNPIMIELKLLNNDEIQKDDKRQEYKNKFVQYTRATNACLSVFWVFDVHKKNSKIDKFNELEIEYQDLNNTLVLLTDCKCSSGVETGLSTHKKKPKVRK